MAARRLSQLRLCAAGHSRHDGSRRARHSLRGRLCAARAAARRCRRLRVHLTRRGRGRLHRQSRVLLALLDAAGRGVSPSAASLALVLCDVPAHPPNGDSSSLVALSLPPPHSSVWATCCVERGHKARLSAELRGQVVAPLLGAIGRLLALRLTPLAVATMSSSHASAEAETAEASAAEAAAAEAAEAAEAAAAACLASLCEIARTQLFPPSAAASSSRLSPTHATLLVSHISPSRLLLHPPPPRMRPTLLRLLACLEGGGPMRRGVEEAMAHQMLRAEGASRRHDRRGSASAPLAYTSLCGTSALSSAADAGPAPLGCEASTMRLLP